MKTAERTRHELPQEVGALEEILIEFEIHLKARSVAQKTYETYTDSVRFLIEFFEKAGGPKDLAHITREDIERFQADLAERGRKPSTISVRHRSLKSFFKWAVDEAAIIERNPMMNMSPPIVPETPMPIIPEEKLKKLFSILSKDKTFEGMRDHALIRFMYDTGVRRAEVTGIRWSDDPEKNDVIDLRAGLVRIFGKNRRERVVHVGAKTSGAMAAYRRVRAKHRYARSPELWLGHTGPLKSNGIFQIVKRRGKQAGLPNLRPHMLRNQFAHEFLVQGGRESDLMALAGWKSAAMVRRYAASAQQERAIKAHEEMGIGDRI